MSEAQQPKPLGRPRKADSDRKHVRLQMRTDDDHKAKADRLASAAGLTLTGWWERQVDKAREPS